MNAKIVSKLGIRFLDERMKHQQVLMLYHLKNRCYVNTVDMKISSIIADTLTSLFPF